MEFTLKLDDDRYSPSVESYQNLMKQMISDLIPYDEYVKMEHIEKLNQEIAEKCEKLFNNLKYSFSIHKYLK